MTNPSLPPESRSLDLSRRLDGIDAFRYFAFVAIGILHCICFVAEQMTPGSLIDHAMRFAVPFFFIVSGFFLAQREDESTFVALRRLIYRLLPVFIFWEAIYIVLFGLHEDWTEPKLYLRTLITGGPQSVHLWFLPALGLGAGGVIVLHRFGLGVIWSCALLLFAAGLALKPYSDALSLPQLNFDTRNGPFFSFIFVVVGYTIASKDIRISLFCVFALLFGGLALQIGEAAFLSAKGYGLFAPYDYLIGTLFYGSGFFFLARHFENAPALKCFAPLGRASLGMYCVHVIFLKWLMTYVPYGDVTAGLMAAVGVVALSTVSGFVLSRISYISYAAT